MRLHAPAQPGAMEGSMRWRCRAISRRVGIRVPHSRREVACQRPAHVLRRARARRAEARAHLQMLPSLLEALTVIAAIAHGLCQLPDTPHFMTMQSSEPSLYISFMYTRHTLRVCK